MLGRSAEADEIARDASARLRDLTGDDDAEFYLGLIAATTGRHQDAVTHLRRFCDLLEARGQRGYLSVFAPMLGRSLCELGRYDEAEPLAQLGRELGERTTPPPRRSGGRYKRVSKPDAAGSRKRSSLPARRLRSTSAPTISTGKATRSPTSPRSSTSAATLDQAEATLVQALECYERKKNLAQAAQVRDRLAALRGVFSDPR